MKNINKKMSVLLIIFYSILFWNIIFNNIYMSINILRDIYYFNIYSYKIIFPLIIIAMFLGFIIISSYFIKKKMFSFILFIIIFNLIIKQYPLYFFVNSSSNKFKESLYYKIKDRFKENEDILDMNSYIGNSNAYGITVDIYKSKTNLELLEENFQSFYISKQIRYYENIGNDLNMENIYSIKSLTNEINNIKKFKDCHNIKNQDVFYFCTKYNIPSQIKYKIYLNNLFYTGINNENLWNSPTYKSFVINNFIHYSESLSNIDLNNMSVEEKSKNNEYREKIKKLLNNNKVDNIDIIKVIENNIILKNRFASQGEIFRNPEKESLRNK